MKRGRHREDLLDQGLRLFAGKGYSATGVQDITDAAGVPKGSFYNYFQSKEDFAIAVLERYRTEAQDFMSSKLSGDGPPLTRLRIFFEEGRQKVEAEGFSGGCLAGRLAQELAGEQPGFRPMLDRVFDCMQGRVAGLLREAAERGEIRPEENPDELASFLLSSWQGAMTRAKAAGTSDALRIFEALVFGRLLPSLAPASVAVSSGTTTAA